MDNGNSAPEDFVESGKIIASGSVGSRPAADRRKLFRRLVALAGLGITGLLISQPQTQLLPNVHAADMVIDTLNQGASTTNLHSTLSNGPAFAATATGTSGAIYGILGESNSPGGIGVQGIATASSGTTIGVYGESDSNYPPDGTAAMGVDGYAKSTTGNTYGVNGQSDSTGGTGVNGYATATSGITYGVFGQSNSTSGHGVDGYASATSGITWGVFGQSDSTSGIGVEGTAKATSGSTCGVWGESDSSSGVGVIGYAGNDGAIPLVARACMDGGQSAHLQEWQNGSSQALSVVDKNGSFGIGTSSPTAGLHVYGNYAFHIRAEGSTGADARIIMKRPSNAQTAGFEFDTGGQSYEWLFGNFYGTNYFAIDYWDGSKDNFWFNILQNGNVGIGTGTPAYTLDVAGQCHATGFPTSSDIRFKEDIAPIDNALDKVLRLNGVYFKWNRLHRETLKRSRNLTNRQMGLVAQQVKEVVPELVSEWADEGAHDYLAVDYSRLGALTIEAIKQLKAENNTLRERIEVLEHKLAS